VNNGRLVNSQVKYLSNSVWSLLAEVIMLREHHAGLHSAVISFLGAMILMTIVFFYPTASFAQQCTAQMISQQACLDMERTVKCNNPNFPDFVCTPWTDPGSGAPGYCMVCPETWPCAGELTNCGVCYSPNPDPKCCDERNDPCCGSTDPCCGSCDECCRSINGGQPGPGGMGGNP
jgi:hypothetical protein